MNIEYLDKLMIPIIVAACLCIGYIMKRWMPQDDKWIPTVLGLLGAISGVIVVGPTYTGVVSGMVSGLAAVGLHQVFKQHLKLPMDGDELYSMGCGYDDDPVQEEVEDDE